jgi:hypothetical protein
MPNLYLNLEAEVASPDSNTTIMTEYISVGEALKLVAPLKGEKRDVLTFIANLDTAFELTQEMRVHCLNSCLLELVGNPGLPLRIGIWKTGKS